MIGTLYIISAPSGGGKTSLVRALIKSTPRICVSVSYTTRPKRPKETDGLSYYFIQKNQFQALIAENAFLEYAQVFGYDYGTPIAWVQGQLQKGIDVILEIDWQGQRQIKEKIPDLISIFLLPPSLETLKMRLIQRGQDHPEIITKRMQKAKFEISHYHAYDYLIVNDNFKKALQNLQSIILSNRLKRTVQENTVQTILNHLL